MTPHITWHLLEASAYCSCQSEMQHTTELCLQEITKEAKWPEGHDGAAPAWKKAVRKHVQTTVSRSHLPDWPMATKTAMIHPASEDEDTKACTVSLTYAWLTPLMCSNSLRPDAH